VRALVAALLATLLAGLGASSARAAPKGPPKAPASQPLPTPAALIGKVEQARAGQASLVGDFVQRKRLSLFRDEVRSTGRFQLRSPDKLRWEYLKPDPSVIILAGHTVTVKAPGQKPATYDLRKQAGLKALLEKLLAALGPATLKSATQDFDLKVTGPQALQLTPKGDLAKHLVSMEMRFDATWQVASLSWREKNGDRTDVTFAGLRRNVKIDDAAFKP
jgi:outer membrane lipoprotein-sorting protein